MASNKKRIGLDQPNGDTLTGIDRLLADLVGHAIEEDEFTIAMVGDRSPGINTQAIRCRLERLVNQGVCTKRRVTVNSRETNAYRYV
jgi:hypothetical protein